MLSIVVALLGSICFALSTIAISRGLLGMDYFTGLLVNLGTNTVLLWFFLAIFSQGVDLWIPANLIFVGAGLLVPGLARFVIFRGMERLGASISSSLTNITPLFAILFAFFFLDERPTLTNLLGAFAIVAGVVFLSWRGQTRTWRTRDLIFPITGAFLFAVRDNLVRYGLLIIHSPVVGATISATTSTLAFGIFYFAAPGLSHPAQANRLGFAWFLVSGVLNFLSYLFMYTALGLDRVSIVSPLINCSSLFVLPLAFFFLKDIEQITPRKILAAVFGVIGVFLVSWEKL